MSEKTNSKFTVRDLINAGLFSVLVLAFFWTGGMIGFLPVLMPLVPFTCGLLSGVVFMLYSTRIKKFGMVLIMGIIFGIVFTLSGHGAYVGIGIVLISLISEWILKKGEYKSIKYARLSYSFYCIASVCMLLPIYISRDSYYQRIIDQGYGVEYAETLMRVLPDWSLIPIVLLGCVGGYIGCTIGIRLLKKHFERGDMA